MAAPTPGQLEFSAGGLRALAYVPREVTPGDASPLVLFLHGALRRPELYLERHIDVADATGTIVLAPYSTIGTWDAIRSGDFGADVPGIDGTLAWVFARWRVDPARIVMSGFSDGGSYALSLGLANGDLFARIAAWSPGFIVPAKHVGRPPILITHGTRDEILPIDRTSRRIVPELRAAGYTVDYREFDGPHAIQQPQLDAMVHQLAGR